MNRIVAVAVVAGLGVTACKRYDVHVVLTPAAEDRRLASGKSDTIKGALERADAANLYVRVDGEVQTIPRAEVVKVDQRLARRDVVGGAVFGGLGVVAIIGSSIAFECGKDTFPLLCLDSDRNILASLTFLLGIGLTGAGLKALVSGMSAQSETNAMLKTQHAGRWHLAPTVVRGDAGTAPGLGATARW
ncbi:MAG: hypothetical protein KF773_11210 [Deltaproteobacteria bacterium]|nr:hypothetical protein [Deltaproteobacteria bacterium]